MTTDKVKAKIHALCPDVLELKFGCEMRWLKGTKDLFIFLDINPNGTLQVKFPNGTIGLRAAAFSDCEILGSPITLAVVLRAITIKQFPDSGQYTAMGSKKVHDVLRLWILSEDNYDQQSEECKQFIGKLLGV